MPRVNYVWGWLAFFLAIASAIATARCLKVHVERESVAPCPPTPPPSEGGQ